VKCLALSWASLLFAGSFETRLAMVAIIRHKRIRFKSKLLCNGRLPTDSLQEGTN